MMMKKCFLLAAALFSLALPATAGAVCFGLQSLQLFSSSPGTIEVNPDAPLGGQIATFTLRTQLTIFSGVSCTGTIGTIEISNEFAPAPGFPGIYQTAVPGVGLKIYNAVLAGYLPQRYVFSGAFRTTVPAASYVVELYRIGTIRSGAIAGGTVYSKMIFIDQGRFTPLQRVIDGPINIVASRPTCAVSAGSVNLPVNLGRPRTGDFSATGATPWVDFAIGLQCRGGAAGSRRNVSLTLTDATVPSNRGQLLNLSAASGARGVGVELGRQDGSLISFGADSALLGNPNQWQAGAVNQGQPAFQIPMKARYRKVGAAISAGSANAVATFTLAYE